MSTFKKTFMTCLAIFALAVTAACGAANKEPVAESVDKADAPAAKPSAPVEQVASGSTGKPGAPFRIDYRIIGTPIVGSPLTIDLIVRSTFGPQPATIEYRINDAGAMTLAEAQPSSIRLEPAANELDMREQVTVVPLREGRLYLNVSAEFASDGGTQSTVTAIPIQVGSGTRDLQENGTVQSDENGEAIRVLDGS